MPPTVAEIVQIFNAAQKDMMPLEEIEFSLRATAMSKSESFDVADLRGLIAQSASDGLFLLGTPPHELVLIDHASKPRSVARSRPNSGSLPSLHAATPTAIDVAEATTEKPVGEIDADPTGKREKKPRAPPKPEDFEHIIKNVIEIMLRKPADEYSLLSVLGATIADNNRSFLRHQRVSMNQLLQMRPDLFEIRGRGPGMRVVLSEFARNASVPQTVPNLRPVTLVNPRAPPPPPPGLLPPMMPPPTIPPPVITMPQQVAGMPPINPHALSSVMPSALSFQHIAVPEPTAPAPHLHQEANPPLTQEMETAGVDVQIYEKGWLEAHNLLRLAQVDPDLSPEIIEKSFIAGLQKGMRDLAVHFRRVPDRFQ